MPRTFFGRTFGNNTAGAPLLPTPPVLTVSDNGNGTGAVATVSNSPASSTNEVLVAQDTGVGSLTFTSRGSRSENGTVTLALGVGNYIGYIHSVSPQGEIESAPVAFSVTSLPSPTHNAGVTIGQNYNPAQAMCFAKVPDGHLIGVNGLDRGLFWDGLNSSVWVLGIDAPLTAPTVNVVAGGGATAGKYLCYYRYLDQYGTPSNFSPAAIVDAVDGSQFLWSALLASTNPRVTTIELWRTQAGEAITFYLIASFANTTSGYTDTVSDNTLAQNAIDDPTTSLAYTINGRPNANRFMPPPDWKAVGVWFQDRMFYFADKVYQTGTINVTNGSKIVVGAGVRWSTNMIGRYLYVVGAPKGYLISDVKGVPLSISRLNAGGAANNNTQQITVGGIPSNVYTTRTAGSPSGGYFTLTFDGQTTGHIAIPATAATVKTALEALSNIGVNNVSVTGTAPTFVVEFIGSKAGTVQPAITGSGTGATGADITVVESRKGSGACNEKQWVGIHVPLGVILGGTFTIEFNLFITRAIPALGTTAAQMKTFLENCPSIGANILNVTKVFDTNQSQIWELEFAGAFTHVNVPQATVDPFRNILSEGVKTSGYDIGTDAVTIQDGSPSGVNERQTVTLPYGLSGGTFQLAYNSSYTGALSYASTAAQISAALNALPTISASGSVVVTGPAGGPWTVEFQGNLGSTDVLSIVGLGTLLTGTNILITTLNAGGGGGNEVQQLTLASATGGTFTLEFDGATTGALPYSASAAEIQAALEGLATIGAGNVSVTGSNRTFTITFVGAESNTSENLITGDGSGLTGQTNLNQLTLAENYGGAGNANASYGIRPKPEELDRIYYSEANEPESVPDVNEVRLQHDQNADDELVGGITFMGGLYLFKQKHLYRLYYVRQPQIDIAIRPVIYRGAFGHRSIGVAETMLFAMDEWGPYLFDGASVQKIGDAIQDYWRDGRIDFSQSNAFHVSTSPEDQTVRFHVALAGDSGPQHAFAYNYRIGAWHLESYAGAIYSVCHYPLADRDRLLYGGASEAVYLANEGTLDGTAGVGTLAGTLSTASVGAVLIDSTAAFPADCVGAPVGIVSGAGKGQLRRITGRTTTTLQVDSSWSTALALGDSYQIGAIRWAYRTPALRYLSVENSNRRELRIIYQPTVAAATLDIRRYFDHDSTPATAPTYQNDNAWGISWESGSPDQVLDLRSTRDSRGPAVGFAPIPDDGSLEDRSQDHRWVSYELRGFQGADQIKLLGFEMYGLESG